MVPTHLDDIRSERMGVMVKEHDDQIDSVNHPSHYQHPSGIEVIEIVRHENFNRGNAIKYILRAGRKPGESELNDLNKAIWYLRDEVERITTLQDAAAKLPSIHWDGEDQEQVNEPEEEEPLNANFNIKAGYISDWNSGYRLEPSANNANKLGVPVATIAQWWAELTARDKGRA